ncbi:urease accessory protein UreE [Mycolicibacterium gilvum]|uniref:Urease accessory protein UreE-like protein n=1 Tax=Mycolicibacterium gilvum TaxID=1804 RepID=A0A378SSC5_9MYCO|nr:urease accessory protein UreE [Mycolicibacterium gilvum]MCV7057891.1 urease accessory protein UreE [Mycolicibacterium gilvum]STZ45521.1 urease accessory protein UreE-like protein [Mycolicibacterium gilvum]
MNAHSIIGDISESRFGGLARHHVDIGWGDATKHRQVVVADTGLVVQLTLPRGSFLRAGAVIAADDTAAVVVRRPAQDAISVRFADNDGVAGARRMLLLGYLLGNQHAPIDVDEHAVAAPLFTSAQAAEELLTELGVTGDVTQRALAVDGWARTSADSHAGHRH